MHNSVVIMFSISLQVAMSLKVDAPTINRTVKALANSRIHINAMITDNSNNRIILGNVRIPNKGTTPALHHRVIFSNVEAISNSSRDHLIRVDQLHNRTIKTTDHNKEETHPEVTSNGKLNVVVSRAKGAAMKVNQIVVVISVLVHRTQINSNSVHLAKSQKRILDHPALVTVEVIAVINFSVQIMNLQIYINFINSTKIL